MKEVNVLGYVIDNNCLWIFKIHLISPENPPGSQLVKNVSSIVLKQSFSSTFRNTTSMSNNSLTITHLEKRREVFVIWYVMNKNLLWFSKIPSHLFIVQVLSLSLKTGRNIFAQFGLCQKFGSAILVCLCVEFVCYPRYLGITRRSCLEAHMVLDMEYREQG
jgi:hypothetical protein